MRMMTLRQPYAYAAVNGLKDVESRDSRPFHSGPVLVVAASRPDLNANASGLPPILTLPRSMAVGVVDIVGCETESDSEWARDLPFHWVLANARRIEPIPWRREPGLAQLEDGELVRIDEALAEAGHLAVTR
jgi:hypothetical protein